MEEVLRDIDKWIAEAEEAARYSRGYFGRMSCERYARRLREAKQMIIDRRPFHEIKHALENITT